MRSSWNIARRVDVRSACVDIRPSSNTDVRVDICDEKISDKLSCRRGTALCWVHVFVDKLSSDSYSAGASGGTAGLAHTRKSSWVGLWPGFS